MEWIHIDTGTHKATTTNKTWSASIPYAVPTRFYAISQSGAYSVRTTAWGNNSYVLIGYDTASGSMSIQRFECFIIGY